MIVVSYNHTHGVDYFAGENDKAAYLIIGSVMLSQLRMVQPETQKKLVALLKDGEFGKARDCWDAATGEYFDVFNGDMEMETEATAQASFDKYLDESEKVE